MKYEVLVIVFPSIFSKNKVSSLKSNIKKVLKIQNQKFRKIRKEGEKIKDAAAAPVYASSAINT